MSVWRRCVNRVVVDRRLIDLSQVRFHGHCRSAFNITLIGRSTGGASMVDNHHACR